MQRFSFRSVFVLAVLLFAFTGAIAQRKQQANDFKQLAGPADEINQMRLPAPENLGNRSKSAMIPVKGPETFNIPIDSPEGLKMMILAPNAKDWRIQMALPSEDFLDPRALMGKGISRHETTYGLGNENFPAEVFEISANQKGSLQLRIDTPQSFGNGTIGYIVIASESRYRLYSYLDTLQTVVGNRIGIVASLFEISQDNELTRPEALRGNISEASAEIRLPNGEIRKGALSANGDGGFRMDYLPSIPGKHIAQITVRGTTPEGDEFIRTSEHLIEVGGSRADIGNKVITSQSDELRFQLSLPVSGLKNGQKVIANAEVWGLNDEGREEAVSWIGGMANANRGRIALSLDSRWLANSGVKGNYELRNIRILDENGSILLGSTDSIEMPGIYPTSAAKGFAGGINDEMRQGKRPAKFETANAVGGKLMLIHGYCAGGNSFPLSHFSNYIVFNDPNQNRSHDQFANLIKNFGAAYPSFGAVAHSQGGAASLHLYTYYFSGLDYATGGSRLIQSVGTPFQGTALAGNLAALGSVFGAGCGSNNNLTYSGAAAWLSGIPSWARAKVYYHTTSFTDVWWRYDYCSLATDAFLGDPEDGVTERAYGQLPGASNMGHKTGWCHTTSMRDPGQTTDSSRNSVMNTNAAR